jgi:hypothetical protein
MVEMQRVNFNHEEDTRRMAPLTSGAVEETMPPCAGVTRRMSAAEMSAVTSRKPSATSQSRRQDLRGFWTKAKGRSSLDGDFDEKLPGWQVQ